MPVSQRRRAWLAQAQAAADKAGPLKPKRECSPEKAAQLGAARLPAAERLAIINSSPRCIAIANHSGKQCKQPALRGATRCRFHGGVLQVPEHPVSIRRILTGYETKRNTIRAAWAKWGAAPPHIRKDVEAIAGPNAHITTKAAGAAAHPDSAQDQGAAWRAWATATRPTR